MAEEKHNSIVGDSEILLEYSKPDIYRKNAFRISGLSVLATNREIISQTNLNKMKAKFGGKENQIESPFPLIPPPSTDDINEALQKLKDPEKRLIDEFFWFWPHELENGKQDEALISLSKNDIHTAQQIWISQENKMSISNVSMHNLAVISHLLALDKEFVNKDKPLSPKEKFRRNTDWRDSFKRWKTLLTNEGFWSRLTKRVRQMNDARLKTGTVRRMKESLPVALLQINGMLAVEYAEKGKIEDAKRHLNLISQSGFEKNDIEKSLKRAVDPLKQRIKTLCKSSIDESKNNPRKANITASRLLEYSKELFKIIDVLLQANDPIRENLYDDVANAVLECEIEYNYKTQDYNTSLGLLKDAKDIVKSNFNLNKIIQNIEQLEELINKNLRWCTNGYWELPDECVNFFEDVRNDYNSSKSDPAIEKLKYVFADTSTLPEHPKLESVLINCIACCLNQKSVNTYSSSLNNYNNKVDEIVITNSPFREKAASSLQLVRNHIVGASLICARCTHSIFSNYYFRSLNGKDTPFCPNCNTWINKQIDNLKKDYTSLFKDSLNLIILANHFLPNNKILIDNLDIISKYANSYNIAGDKPVEIMKRMNLLSIAEILKLLASNDTSFDAQFFHTLKKVILTGKNNVIQKITSTLFEQAFTDEKSVRRFFPFFISVEGIKNELFSQYFNGRFQSYPSDQNMIIKYLSDTKNYKEFYKIIDHIPPKGLYKEYFVEKLLEKLFESIYKLIRECEPNNLLKTVDKIIEIIQPSAHYSKFLEQRLISFFSEIIKYPPQSNDGIIEKLGNLITGKLLLETSGGPL